MSSLHSFLDLPFVARDTILENLGRVELSSISLTCRSLHRDALKHLYRDLLIPTDWYFWGLRENRKTAVEPTLRRYPNLLPYVRSFTSRDRAFLRWIFAQATPPMLECLDIQWNVGRYATGSEIPIYSGFVDLIPPRARDSIHDLKFTIKSAERSMLSSLSSFRCLQ